MELSREWFCRQVEEHKTALYRLARSILSHDQDAEDAVMEAVCKAFSQLGRLREPERFRPWIMRIVANEAYTLLRKRRPTAPLEEAGSLPSPPPAETLGLWPLILALPDSLRAPVTLFYYEGFSLREISHILHLGEGAVKTRLHRGRQMLKKQLEQEGEHEF